MEPFKIFITQQWINYHSTKLINFLVFKDISLSNNKLFQVRSMINDFLLFNLTLDFYLYKMIITIINIKFN